MGFDKNNNEGLLYRIARNNLLSKKLSSFFCALSVFLAVTLASTVSLYVSGYQLAEKRMLEQMQHVLYMNVTEKQAQELGNDSRIAESVPYKYCEKKYETDGAAYQYVFFGTQNGNRIRTYELTEGTAPKAYHEIAVEKAFLTALKKEEKLGTKVMLNTGQAMEEFTVCAFTDSRDAAGTHIYTSAEFAAESPVMKDMPYEALVRIRDADTMGYDSFSAAVYQIAADYGIDRQNVNTNGKFEQMLQSEHTGTALVLFLGALLFLAGGIVIYSIFYFSVISRVQQIGQFQTVGMTEKQVKKMIRREGLLISGAATPPALLAGGLIAYFLLPDGWSFFNYGMVCLITGAAAIVIVQLCVRKPALIASKISPIQAAKSAGRDFEENSGHPTARKKNSGHLTAGKKNSGHLTAGKENSRQSTAGREHSGHLTAGKEHGGGLRGRRLLTPYVLARMESSRSRKKWLLVTASLALGGILFMTAATWNASWDKDDFSRQEEFENGEIKIKYLYDGHTSQNAYGITQMQLTGHLNQELKSRILNLPHVKNVREDNSVTCIIEYQGSIFTQPLCPLTKDDTEYFQIPAEGNLSYDYMVQNDAVLITDADFVEKINGVSFQPGDRLTLRYFDGTEHQTELEIAAVSEKLVSAGKNSDRTDFAVSDATMKKLWKSFNTADTFTVSVEDYEQNGLQAEEAVRKLVNGYDDLSMYTLREKKLEDAGLIQEKQAEIYGISFLIILFSMFNLMNTVIGSFASRKRELSMLESVGMQQRQMRRMLLWESFLLALPNLAVTLTAGTLAGYGFIRFMQKSASYLHYQFPAAAVLIYAAAMILIPAVLSALCLKEQNRMSLVERIKTD